MLNILTKHPSVFFLWIAFRLLFGGDEENGSWILRSTSAIFLTLGFAKSFVHRSENDPPDHFPLCVPSPFLSTTQKEAGEIPTYLSRLLFGGGVGFKTEHRHRGMKFGIAPHSPDDWGRQLAAGGDEGN